MNFLCIFFVNFFISFDVVCNVWTYLIPTIIINQGQFQPSDGPLTWMHQPRPLPVDFRKDRMMYVTIMDHMANSAGHAFHNKEMLKINISAHQVSWSKCVTIHAWPLLSEAVPKLQGRLRIYIYEHLS